jgi:hypothetical protein
MHDVDDRNRGVAVPAAAVPSQLRVDLVLAGRPVKPRVAAAAIRETRHLVGLWRRRALGCSAGRWPRWRAGLSITLIGGSDPGDLQTLGVTLFVEGRPLPSIRLFPDAVAALLSSEMLVVRDCIRSSDVCQDVLAGRVLGRALAHEIGHYLLASRGHSRKGLMRLAADRIAHRGRCARLPAVAWGRLAAGVPARIPASLTTSLFRSPWARARRSGREAKCGRYEPILSGRASSRARLREAAAAG